MIHIIFDLDGTLIDTESLMREAWSNCAIKFRLEHTFEDYKKFIGRPFSEILDLLGINNHQVQIEETYFNYSLKNSRKISFFPGALDFIGQLERESIPWSLVTSKTRMNVMQIIESVNINPQFIHCSNERGMSKPDSRIIEQLYSDLALGPESATLIYFGDMLIDFIFAINSEIHYIHCNFGSGGKISDYIYPRPSAIDNWHQAYTLVSRINSVSGN